jgi:hypothetical protein
MKNNPIALVFVAAFVVSSTVACDSVRSPIPPSGPGSTNGSTESFILRGTVVSDTESGSTPLVGELVTDSSGTFECGGLTEGQWVVRISQPDGDFEETVMVSSDISPTFLLKDDDLTVLLSVSKVRRTVPRVR